MGFESCYPVVRAAQDRKQTFHQPGVVARLCSCTPQQIIISIVVANMVWTNECRFKRGLLLSPYAISAIFHPLFLLFFSFPFLSSCCRFSFIFPFPFPRFRVLFVSFYFHFQTGFITKTFSETKCLFLTQQQSHFPTRSMFDVILTVHRR